MKLTGKAPKKTVAKKTAAKKTAASLPKLPIVDACATPRCVNPPTKGSSYCADHGAPEKGPHVRGAETKAKAKAKAKAAKLDPVRAQLARLIAGTPSLKKSAPPKPATKAKVSALVADKGSARPPEKKAAADTDARPAIETLLEKGWSTKAIASSMETSAGHVYQWRKGSSCRRLAQLQSLVLLPVPKKEKAVSGSLKAPRPAAAAKSVVARKGPDPRQLVLQLTFIRDAISAILAGE